MSEYWVEIMSNGWKRVVKNGETLFVFNDIDGPVKNCVVDVDPETPPKSRPFIAVHFGEYDG